jgi:peptidoglycan hydrolase CwlO-like protein
MKKTLILLTAFSLLSCGTMKKSIDKEETETEIKTESNSVLDYEKESYTLEPVNLERPILVGGKEYHNTKIIYAKDKGTETKQEVAEVKQETETLHKEIERDNTTLFLGIAGAICFFLFLIVLVILWYINKKLTI